MTSKFDEFLKLLTREGNEHRRIAKNLMREINDENDRLNDVKYHDGMADQAIALSIEFQQVFGEELQ